MKISEQPTNHILVKAYTNSEWDNCDFAIVSCGDSWKEQMTKRLNAVVPFRDDNDFFAIKYYDTGADFYTSGDDETEVVLPDGMNWVFVELEENEEDTFNVPESRLDCWRMVVHKDGRVHYQASGKHTGEEFYTDDLPVKEILEIMQNHQTSEPCVN